MNDAAALGKAIKDGTTVSGSMLIEATIHSEDGGSSPEVSVEMSEAVRLITQLKPRVVYLLEQTFDLTEELETAAEDLGAIDSDSSPHHLKAIRSGYSQYDGQIGAAIASFMVDGILHTAFSTANWYDDFGDTIEALTEGTREEAENARFSERSIEAKELGRKASLLAEHPSFNHGRVSFDKRMTLAEALFEDCDQGELSEITRRAENIFWLNQSGFKKTET